MQSMQWVHRMQWMQMDAVICYHGLDACHHACALCTVQCALDAAPCTGCGDLGPQRLAGDPRGSQENPDAEEVSYKSLGSPRNSKVFHQLIMVFLLRLRTSQGMKRLLFRDDSCTLEDLMLQIKDLTGISPVDQKLVKTDPIKNKSIPIDVRDVRMPIHKISLNKGDLIHLKESQNVRAKTNHKPKKKPESKVEQPVKKGPHMTFKAFVKISGKPTIPNYEDFLFQPNRQRSVSSYAPNVHWKLQRYRHTDIISFPDPMVLQKFYRNSLPELKQGMSRIGIMFGRYVEDVNPLVKQNVTDDLKRQKKWDFDANGVRGDVYAIYEPPQEAQKNGARFLTDPRQEVVQILAEEMGLEAIGLAICKVKAKEDPKGFQTFLTGAELLQLARLQSVFRDQDGFSRFGCVLIEQAELIEPRAFAASDICVALEGSNLLDTVEGHPFKLRCKIPEGVRASDMPQFYIPKDNDMSGGTHQAKEKIKTGDPFPIDFLTVKIIVGQGRGLHGLMKHIEFPLNGTLKDLKGYMERHSGETFHQKFSDFNLILNLPDFFEDEKDKECAVEIAACIGKRLEFPPELCEKLDIWFVKKSLF